MSMPASATAPARTIRLLVLSFAGAMVVMAGVAALVLPPTGTEQPPPLALVALAAVPLVGLALAQLVGHRVAPLRPSETTGSVQEVQATAVQHLVPGLMVRLALAETPFVALLAVSFVLPYGPWPVLAAVGPAVAVLLLVAWPSRRTVRRLADQLESDGVRSHLPEAFGHA